MDEAEVVDGVDHVFAEVGESDVCAVASGIARCFPPREADGDDAAFCPPVEFIWRADGICVFDEYAGVERGGAFEFSDFGGRVERDWFCDAHAAADLADVRVVFECSAQVECDVVVVLPGEVDLELRAADGVGAVCVVCGV